MIQSGITYFMLDTNIYRGDYTKNCSLTGGEIDKNFNFLRGMDIIGGYFDENNGLHLINLGGEDIGPITGLTFEEPVLNIDFSGSSYDGETGVLNLCINGETIQLEGFNTCDCEELKKEIYEMGCQVENHEIVISGLTEDFESFKETLDNITSDSKLNSAAIAKAIVALTNENEKLGKQVTTNMDNIKELDNRIGKEEKERKDEDVRVNNEINNLKDKDTYIYGKINDLTTDVEGIKDNVGNIQHNIGSIKEDIGNIKTNIIENSEKIEDLDRKIDEESKRAIGREDKLSDDITKIKDETLADVSDKLKEQDKSISNIGEQVKNVLTTTQEALGFSQEALKTSNATLAELKKHEITDIVLNGDQLSLHYKEPDHISPGISLAKYNYTADEETIHKDGSKFSAIVDKEKGLVSWERFIAHVAKYNELLEKYNALETEFNEYKNANKYYMGVVGEDEFDVGDNYIVNPDIILQHKYLVDYNPISKQCTYICDKGNYFMVAVPKGKTFEVRDDLNQEIALAKISSTKDYKNYQDKCYDIYITVKMSFEAGSKYILTIM